MFTICKCALCKHFGCKAALLLGKHWPRGSTGRRPVSTGRRPVRKKRPTNWGFFFWFPLRFSDASSRSGLTHFSPHSNIYLSSILDSVQSSEAAPGASPGQVKTCKVSLANRSSERLKLGTLKFYFELFKLLQFRIQCLTLGTLNFVIFKVSLAKRSSERLPLGILISTFQF